MGELAQGGVCFELVLTGKRWKAARGGLYVIEEIDTCHSKMPIQRGCRLAVSLSGVGVSSATRTFLKPSFGTSHRRFYAVQRGGRRRLQGQDGGLKPACEKAAAPTRRPGSGGGGRKGEHVFKIRGAEFIAPGIKRFRDRCPADSQEASGGASS
jgi:hypothetical protein